MIKRLAASLSAIIVLGGLLSGCIRLSPNQKKEINVRLKDTEWITSPDSSVLVFEDKHNFRFYRDDDARDDNYYEGEYDFYTGDDAVEYITEDLEDYGLTEKEIDRFIDDEQPLENFVCLVLHNESCIADGEEIVDEPYDTPYYGFLSDEDDERSLTLVNMNTANLAVYDEKD